MASSVAQPPSTTTSCNIFKSLPARPPTPPRETSAHDPDVSLKSLALSRSQAFDPCRSLQTPPNAGCPRSAIATRSNPSSSHRRKRVEWSVHTEYKEAPQYPSVSGPGDIKSSPLSAPSSATAKPIKGILKPSPSPKPLSSSLGGDLDGTAAQPNVTEMLDSTIKHLAGADRDSKLDAYMMLSRALKTSNNLPDRVALQAKMSLFMQFIQRDMTSKTETGALDASLVNHALTLLATFLQFQAIASTLTSDFGVFVIDHAIRSFEDISVPKDVVRHLMQAVAFQSFPAKVMTLDRVGRLVIALHGIGHHMKGKSVVMSRLLIYKRLVQQSRACMVTHSDWLQDMFTDMLSSVKDIRAQAISLAVEAGFALRSDKTLFRKVNELFSAQHEDESYMDFFIQRLQHMLKDKQTSAAMPQIWGATILFLRFPLDKWQHYSPWLVLVQSAFNTPDAATKHEANRAWNRYVYLSLVDCKLSPKSIATLCQPLLSQLRRKVSGAKQQEEAMKLRRAVFGGICSLYYFSVAQGGAKYPIDVIWDVAVHPVMTQLVSLDDRHGVSGDCTMQAARTLVGLLDVSTPRPSRNLDRIMDAAPVHPEELLPLDPKWIRRNCVKVFEAVGPILDRRFVDLANKESLAFRLWKSLIGSVVAASAKDIKVSDDTAKFLACSFGFLSKVWSAGLADGARTQSEFLASVTQFVRLLVDGLGLLPFTEKKLSLRVDSNFESVATPTQRLSKPNPPSGVARISLHHLFLLMCTTPPGCVDDAELADLFRSAFEPFFASRSAKGRVELAQELMQLLPRSCPSACGPWLLLADHMKLPFANSLASRSSLVTTNQPLASEHLDIVSHLERGLTCHPGLPIAHWGSLFDAICNKVVEDIGDAGVALLVVDPIAKGLLETLSKDTSVPSMVWFQAMALLCNVVKLPCDGQTLDAVRLQAWGTPSTGAGLGPSDPCDSLYKLGNHVMQRLYAQCSDFGTRQEVEVFAESFLGFVARSLPRAVITTISNMQLGLCPWIRDEKDWLQLNDGSAMSKIIRSLWDQVCSRLATYGRLLRDDFDQVQLLLTAAFESKDAYIVSTAAELWNTWAKGGKLECSDSLLSTVSSLRTSLGLFGPGTELSNGSVEEQLSTFRGATDGHGHSSHNHASAELSATTSSKRSLHATRQTESVTDNQDSAKGRRAPRLRRNTSSIRSPPAAPCSASNHELPNLAAPETQVWKSQQESVALVADSSHSGSANPESKAADSVAIGMDDVKMETTPQRKSFDDMITLTPTPRRGQVLPMEGMNDPPSSPPVPRPYPLLSEIQSRVRANSSMEDWRFSSPTGSSAAGNQQATTGCPKSSSPPLPEEPSRPKPPRRRTRRQKRNAATERAAAKTLPPSVMDADDSPDTDNTQESGGLPNPTAHTPSTPPLRHLSPPSKTQRTAKSGDEAFVDARSQPMDEEAHSSCDMEPSVKDALEDTYFALSEGDEHQMVDLAMELETGHYELPAAGELVTPTKKSMPSREAGQGCITVYTDLPLTTSPSPTRRRESKRLASQAPKSSPTKAVDEGGDGGRTRKRKRGFKEAETRSKKKRSREAGRETRVEEASSNESAVASADSGHTAQHSNGVKTRGGSRKRKLQAPSPADAKTASPKASAEILENVKGNLDGGDTDEELLSQLVTESFAASQAHDEQQTARPRSSAKEKLAGRADVKKNGEKDTDGGGEERQSIMESLRTGLAQLRNASLDRETVYAMEDLLMDMKRELYKAERRGRARA
ncbi:hypothetical protein RJ55_03473 [Drechmeria coniospora]|nr:hypothetical protein RJ55_03473 [Drechmeria coniospora]